MGKTFAIAIMTALILVTPCKAETVTAYATAYNITGTTATGTYTTEGRTIAGMREWFGKVLVVWEDPDGSGIIKPENYIGTYICEDTGSAKIKEGHVVDVYISDLRRAKEFGSKKVIIKIIDSEG